MMPLVPSSLSAKPRMGFSIDSLMGKMDDQESSSADDEPIPAGHSSKSGGKSPSVRRSAPSSPLNSAFSPAEMAGHNQTTGPMGGHLPFDGSAAFYARFSAAAAAAMHAPSGQLTHPGAHLDLGHLQALNCSSVQQQMINQTHAAAVSAAAAARLHPMILGMNSLHREAAYPIHPWFLSRHGPDASSFLLQPFRKPKRIRTAFSPSQLLKLEHAFEKNHYVVGAERKQLAQSLGLTETQVKVWFQNRRTKHKRVKCDDDPDDGDQSCSTVSEKIMTSSSSNNQKQWVLDSGGPSPPSSNPS